MKKIGIILACMVATIFLIVLTYDAQNNILNASNCINIFLILLGFAITCYTFTYDVMSKIMSNFIVLEIDIANPCKSSKTISKQIKDNILFIVCCIAIMIICKLIKEYNIPFINDISIYSFNSLKKLILMFFYYLAISLSIYAFMDIIIGLFKLVTNSFNILEQANTLTKEDTTNE